MRTLLPAVLAFLQLGVSAAAQTITDRLAWTQPGITTVAEAQALKYSYIIDTGTPVVAVQTCALSPAVPPAIGTIVTCSAPVTPVVPPGQHNITLLVDNGFAIASATIGGRVPDAATALRLVVTFTIP